MLNTVYNMGMLIIVSDTNNWPWVWQWFLRYDNPKTEAEATTKN